VARAGDVLALDGDLGAGKTQLVRGIAEGLGLDPRQVSSPTFVIVSIYEKPLPGRVFPAALLAHADAYRLSGPDDLDSVGWDAVVNAGDCVVCVEWATRIAAALTGGGPGGTDGAGRTGGESLTRITLAAPLVEAGEKGEEAEGPPTRREISITVPDEWARRPEWAALVALAPTARAAEAGRCPVCGRAVAKDAATHPFDSVRCRDADLGRWLSGQYSISRELKWDDDAEE